MTEAQIKHMVDRFLNWKLPEHFNPDGGISFKKTFNEHTAYPAKNEPTGTNLFGADQADAMVRHMLDGLPAAADQPVSDRSDSTLTAIGLCHAALTAHNDWHLKQTEPETIEGIEIIPAEAYADSTLYELTGDALHAAEQIIRPDDRTDASPEPDGSLIGQSSSPLSESKEAGE